MKFINDRPFTDPDNAARRLWGGGGKGRVGI